MEICPSQATTKNAEVLINDDSQSDWGPWVKELAGLAAGGMLVYSPNIHEIRGYNRLAKLARGRILVFAQVLRSSDSAPTTALPLGELEAAT